MTEQDAPQDPMQVMQSKEQAEAGLETINQAVNSLASAYHEDWRQTRLQEDGNYEPRVKPTTDEAWIASHDGNTEVDIANTEYEDLPADWQEENKAAAEVVVDMLLKKDGKVDLSDETEANEAGNVVHDAWLSRNGWAKGGELDKPFEDLPEDEKAKDLNQVEIALELFKGEEIRKSSEEARENIVGIIDYLQSIDRAGGSLPEGVRVHYYSPADSAIKYPEFDAVSIDTPEGGRWGIRKEGEPGDSESPTGITYVPKGYKSGGDLPFVSAKSIGAGESIKFSRFGAIGDKSPDDAGEEDHELLAEQRYIALAKGVQARLEDLDIELPSQQ